MNKIVFNGIECDGLEMHITSAEGRAAMAGTGTVLPPKPMPSGISRWWVHEPDGSWTPTFDNSALWQGNGPPEYPMPGGSIVTPVVPPATPAPTPTPVLTGDHVVTWIAGFNYHTAGAPWVQQPGSEIWTWKISKEQLFPQGTGKGGFLLESAQGACVLSVGVTDGDFPSERTAYGYANPYVVEHDFPHPDSALGGAWRLPELPAGQDFYVVNIKSGDGGPISYFLLYKGG